MAFSRRGFLLRQRVISCTTSSTFHTYGFVCYPIDGKPAISSFKELCVSLQHCCCCSTLQIYGKFFNFPNFCDFFDQKQTLNFHSLRLTTFAFCFLCKYTKKILKVKCFSHPLKRICRQQRTFLSVVFFWGFGHIDTSPIPKYHYERIVFFIDQAR